MRWDFCNANRATLMNYCTWKIFQFFFNDNLILLLLYGDNKFDDTKNRQMLMLAIRFIKDSQRFDNNFGDNLPVS